MPSWSKIRKGDRVELKGADYEVVKIKPKGSHAKVTVRGKSGTFESKVPLDGKVKRAPLRDDDGAMKRWATKREAADALGMPRGDASITKPPGKLSADPWDSPRDKTERLLERALGAVLIGEATDEGAGYYVPPVDVSTVAGHLLTFHGAVPELADEVMMLTVHDVAHEAALNGGTPLKVNHWHTKTRPATS